MEFPSARSHSWRKKRGWAGSLSGATQSADFTARPFVWRDPKSFPPRQWLHAGHYIRCFVSATIAPGGLGKSSVQLVEAIGMAIGLDLLRGDKQKKLNVWYWNLEDPFEEIERRIAAILLHYGIDPAETAGRLFVNSGRDDSLVIAEKKDDATTVCKPVVQKLYDEILRLEIDVVIVDPFVSCHRLPENDNGAIDTVIKTWAHIAEVADCGVELAHHVRKPGNGSAGAEFDINDARGSSSFIGATRSNRVLNRMSKDEAQLAGIALEFRRIYFRADKGDKDNMRPPVEKAEWHKFASVSLENATLDDPADSIGVVTAWTMPGLMEGVTDSGLAALPGANGAPIHGRQIGPGMPLLRRLVLMRRPQMGGGASSRCLPNGCGRRC